MQHLTLKKSLQPTLFKLRQLGWQAHVGIALIVLTVVLFLAFILPKKTDLTEFNRHIFELKAADVKHNKTNNIEQNNADIAERFYAILPVQSDANHKISQILQTVHEVGLVSNKAEFNQIAVPETGLIKYQIKLPVLGSYMNTRQFIHSVFNQFPSVALSNISLNRDDVNNDAVASNIELVLYVRKSP